MTDEKRLKKMMAKVAREAKHRANGTCPDCGRKLIITEVDADDSATGQAHKVYQCPSETKADPEFCGYFHIG